MVASAISRNRSLFQIDAIEEYSQWKKEHASTEGTLGYSFARAVDHYQQDIADRYNKVWDKFETEMREAQPLSNRPYDIAVANKKMSKICEDCEIELTDLHNANSSFCAGALQGAKYLASSGATKNPQTHDVFLEIGALHMAPPLQEDRRDEVLQEVFGHASMEDYEKQVENGMELRSSIEYHYAGHSDELIERDRDALKEHWKDKLEIPYNPVIDSFSVPSFLHSAKKEKWQELNPGKKEPTASQLKSVDINSIKSLTTPNNLTFENASQTGQWVLKQSASDYGGISRNLSKDEVTIAFVQMISAMQADGMVKFSCQSTDPAHLQAFRDAAALCGVDKQHINLTHERAVLGGQPKMVDMSPVKNEINKGRISKAASALYHKTSLPKKAKAREKQRIDKLAKHLADVSYDQVKNVVPEPKKQAPNKELSKEAPTAEQNKEAQKHDTDKAITPPTPSAPI